MADNKVNFLRGTSAEYEAKTKDNDTFYYTTDTKKLYLGENEVGNGIDPKVIQAHIDNQTIHAKVWRGTQEEYNAIEPKEDDTIYIIKDSDNTLADKLIDDTSTTATGKTWSAKKINENDELARAAINAHSGNAEIHVTAEEKASWNGKAELSDIPTTLPANGGNADTAETIDGKSSADLAYLTNVIGGLRRGWASTNIGTIMTYGDRQVVKTTNDLSYFGWCVNGEGWFFPVIISQYPNGTKYKIFEFDCGYELDLINDPDKVARFDYKGRTYYACWQNSGSLQYPAVSGGLCLEFTNDYISMCKTLIDACEAIDAETVDGLHASDFALKADIPTSLPADGGNADTLDGLHESSFAQNIGVWNEGDIKDLLLACQKSGFVWIQPGVTGMPNDGTYWFGIADCHTVHRQLIVRDIQNSVSYCMRWNNGTQTWISWRNLADGGNAASVGTYTEAKIAALEARIAALEAKG